MVLSLVLFIVYIFPSITVALHNLTAGGCAIIRPPRDGGIRYRGLTQEQIRSVQILPVDYEIEYICRGSRVIVGPKVRKCLPNGTWTDLALRSRCLLQCSHVWASLENGQVKVWPLGAPVEGSVLQYSCLPGFILGGPNSSVCTKLGKWDSPKPACHYDRNYTGLIRTGEPGDEPTVTFPKNIPLHLPGIHQPQSAQTEWVEKNNNPMRSGAQLWRVCVGSPLIPPIKRRPSVIPAARRCRGPEQSPTPPGPIRRNANAPSDRAYRCHRHQFSIQHR
ncbi:hypothetical protein SKAU_G00302890 [Synaphobranchus kaupii]|uniref:Sushi domain-containing protein n=1 Tax=Synaphobranchus kaupii TaxID=118154 RepID=A0A9Q1EW49_SYNKA|nr:hypothetical protein SKAU_G00302890 [Synaphobranchus kaupii]